jgi:hypothetical protein
MKINKFTGEMIERERRITKNKGEFLFKAENINWSNLV